MSPHQVLRCYLYFSTFLAQCLGREVNRHFYLFTTLVHCHGSTGIVLVKVIDTLLVTDMTDSTLKGFYFVLMALLVNLVCYTYQPSHLPWRQPAAKNKRTRNYTHQHLWMFSGLSSEHVDLLEKLILLTSPHISKVLSYFSAGPE